MPTYEYLCQNCSYGFEVEQKISESPLRKCPKCKKLKLKKQISSGNFILKGGGWYSDLYSGPSNSGPSGSEPIAKKSEKSGDAKSSSDASTSSDTSKKSKSSSKKKAS